MGVSGIDAGDPEGFCYIFGDYFHRPLLLRWLPHYHPVLAANVYTIPTKCQEWELFLVGV